MRPPKSPRALHLSTSSTLLTTLLLIPSISARPDPNDTRSCYWLNGQAAQSSTPCNNATVSTHSMCCNIAKGEICMPFGICMVPAGSNVIPSYDNGHSYWRESCTDPTYQDPSCLYFANKVTSGPCRLTQCDQGGWCARNEEGPADACCTGGGVKPQEMKQNYVKPTTSTTTSGSSVITVTSSATSMRSTTVSGTPTAVPVSATDAVTNQSTGGLSQGALIGLCVALGLVAAILIALIIFLAWRAVQDKKRYQDEKRGGADHGLLNPAYNPAVSPAGYGARPPATIASPLLPTGGPPSSQQIDSREIYQSDAAEIRRQEDLKRKMIYGSPEPGFGFNPAKSELGAAPAAAPAGSQMMHGQPRVELAEQNPGIRP